MSRARRIEVLPAPDELHDRFAAVVAGGLRDAVAARGRATLALSRGSDAFRKLAAAEVPWKHVDVFQVDERAAPDGSDGRNLTAIERELAARIPAPGPRVHAMPVTADLGEAAVAYAGELVSACGSPPVLDVIHLGLGTDGHTASLFPGEHILEEGDEWVAAAGPKEGMRRLTLTLPVLQRARLVVFLVSGREKAEAARALLAGDGDIPAASVRAREVCVLLDPDAAALVPSDQIVSRP